MLGEISARQFIELETFEGLEPADDLKDDWRTASIVAMVFNMAVQPKDRRPVSEFLIDWTPREGPVQQTQTWQQQLAIAKVIAMAYNGAERMGDQ